MRVLSKLAADKLSAPQHVGPLIVPAKLHVTSIVLEHMVEIVRLHDHIVKLQEGQPLFHSLLVALRPKHVVHGKAGSYLPDQIHIVQVQQPVSVVEHDGFVLAKFDKTLHLPLKAPRIMINILLGEHLTHISTARWISNHGGAAAYQGNRTVARLLKPLHQRQRHKMSGSQAIRRTVKSNIKRGLTAIDHLSNLVLISNLGNQPPGHQFLINLHIDRSLSFFIPLGPVARIHFLGQRKNPLLRLGAEDVKDVLPPLFAVPSRKRPQKVPKGLSALYRAHPSNPTERCLFRRLLQGVFPKAPSPPFTYRGLSAQKRLGY